MTLARFLANARSLSSRDAVDLFLQVNFIGSALMFCANTQLWDLKLDNVLVRKLPFELERTFLIFVNSETYALWKWRTSLLVTFIDFESVLPVLPYLMKSPASNASSIEDFAFPLDYQPPLPGGTAYILDLLKKRGHNEAIKILEDKIPLRAFNEVSPGFFSHVEAKGEMLQSFGKQDNTLPCMARYLVRYSMLPLASGGFPVPLSSFDTFGPQLPPPLLTPSVLTPIPLEFPPEIALLKRGRKRSLDLANSENQSPALVKVVVREEKQKKARKRYSERQKLKFALIGSAPRSAPPQLPPRPTPSAPAGGVAEILLGPRGTDVFGIHLYDTEFVKIGITQERSLTVVAARDIPPGTLVTHVAGHDVTLDFVEALPLSFGANFIGHTSMSGFDKIGITIPCNRCPVGSFIRRSATQADANVIFSLETRARSGPGRPSLVSVLARRDIAEGEELFIFD